MPTVYAQVNFGMASSASDKNTSPRYNSIYIIYYAVGLGY